MMIQNQDTLSLAGNNLPSTFACRLQYWARLRPTHLAYAFLEGGEVVDALNFKDLQTRVEQLAYCIEQNTQRNDRVLLLLNPGLDYVVAFLACVWVQRIAVTAYAPTSEKNSGRLRTLCMDAEPALVLYSHSHVDKVQQLLGAVCRAQMLAIEEAWQHPKHQAPPCIQAIDDIAFLQYTSGSTSDPKGVMVSHANLWHNSQAIYQRFGHTLESRVVSWLPPYHDMGLIGGILQSLYGGFSSYLMSPIEFLQRPQRWLQAISKYAGTSAGGPNFAYQLCVDRVKDEHMAGLDLSHWHVAFNGAEPIGSHTLEQFTRKFGQWGFKAGSVFACYGLAEATLLLASGQAGEGARAVGFEAEALTQGRAVLATAPRVSNARMLVSCGRVVDDHALCIVDPQTSALCADGEVGEICFAGPSVAQGYWRKSETTTLTFAYSVQKKVDTVYLRTGDLGFVCGGELFVNGRLKDLIIIKGVNYHPADIEQLLQRQGLVQGLCGIAAVGVLIDDAEKLVVLLEVESKLRQATELEQRMAQVRTQVFEEFKLTPHAVFVLRAGALPRTSSGKIQRQHSGVLCALALAATVDDKPWPSALASWAPHLLAVAVSGRLMYTAPTISCHEPLIASA
jgi:acyl-CoA synthetase (AMP-forming)/AMP-acid ligase II